MSSPHLFASMSSTIWRSLDDKAANPYVLFVYIDIYFTQLYRQLHRVLLHFMCMDIHRITLLNQFLFNLRLTQTGSTLWGVRKIWVNPVKQLGVGSVFLLDVECPPVHLHSSLRKITVQASDGKQAAGPITVAALPKRKTETISRRRTSKIISSVQVIAFE